MERRYKLLSKLGVRNLAGYNTKIDEARRQKSSSSTTRSA
jgi:S-DNA-T family DNA segregation ATPase FtsK/SpoIIIE